MIEGKNKTKFILPINSKIFKDIMSFVVKNSEFFDKESLTMFLDSICENIKTLADADYKSDIFTYNKIMTVEDGCDLIEINIIHETLVLNFVLYTKRPYEIIKFNTKDVYNIKEYYDKKDKFHNLHICYKDKKYYMTFDKYSNMTKFSNYMLKH